MGSGVVGVATAYMLAKDGHKVKVVDTAKEPARGSSFANGAQLSFSHIHPLSSSESLKQLTKALIKPKSCLSIDSFDKKFLQFTLNLIKNSSRRNSLRIAGNLFGITQLSKEIFDELIMTEEIKFDFSRTGILHIFRNERSLEEAKRFAKFQRSIGDEAIALNLDECVEKEPLLVKMTESRSLKGGIFYPGDACGNPYLFSQSLAKICVEKYGVEFSFNDPIKNILTDSKKITGVNCENGVYRADKYVYCLGASGLSLLKGIGIETGIYPVIGASLSIKADRGTPAPKIGITDPENRLVYSRIGNVFRAAGGIYINKSPGINHKIHKFIENKIKETFLNYGNLKEVVNWENYRPLRADSTPLICNVEKYGNFYLNTGHGHLGWTMSCGSAEIIRRLIEKKNVSGLSFLKKSF